MLPSPSPQFTATAMWGPILAWCALELLAESIDIEKPERVALDLFDRLRLREPFAQAFAALGFEGEEGWRVAARIKILLLTGAGVGNPEEAPSEPEPSTAADTAEVAAKAEAAKAAAKPEAKAAAKTEVASVSDTVLADSDKTHPEPQEVSGHDFSRAGSSAKTTGALAPERSSPSVSPESKAEAEPLPTDEKVALAPALWFDPDVRWLTGVHEAEGHLYLVRELYEELLWWLLMPSLLRLAGETTPSRAEVEELSKTVEEALVTAKAANYRIDELLGSAVAPENEEADALTPEDDSNTIEEGTVESIERVPEPPE